jgi:hypothetical protein
MWTNAFVEGGPVERGLELGSVVGLDLLDLEREPGQYAVKELNRRLLVRLGQIRRIRRRAQSSIAVYW